MQPTPGGNIPGLLLQNRDTGKAQAPLNSAAFMSKPIEEVPVDQVFFHKYFSQVGNRSKISARKPAKEAQASDDEGEGDEDEVWKAIIGSKPELDPNDEEDDDLELDDDDLSDDEGVDMESSEASPQPDIELDDVSADGHLDLDAESLFDSEDDLPSETAGRVPDQPAGGQKANRAKRQKLKHLPTFAPADQYESMLVGEEV
jgi:ribosome biogenesis protein MAK21